MGAQRPLSFYCRQVAQLVADPMATIRTKIAAIQLPRLFETSNSSSASTAAAAAISPSSSLSGSGDGGGGRTNSALTFYAAADSLHCSRDILPVASPFTLLESLYEREHDCDAHRPSPSRLQSSSSTRSQQQWRERGNDDAPSFARDRLSERLNAFKRGAFYASDTLLVGIGQHAGAAVELPTPTRFVF